jgi:hypothetical protein
VISGEKWSANVWIWNRHKPGKDKALDGKGKEKEDDNSIYMRFENTQDETVILYWDDGTDEGVFQVEIEPEDSAPMNTYHGHKFFAKKKSGGPKIFSFIASDNQEKELMAQI